MPSFLRYGIDDDSQSSPIISYPISAIVSKKFSQLLSISCRANPTHRRSPSSPSRRTANPKDTSFAFGTSSCPFTSAFLFSFLSRHRPDRTYRFIDPSSRTIPASSSSSQSSSLSRSSNSSSTRQYTPRSEPPYLHHPLLLIGLQIRCATGESQGNRLAQRRRMTNRAASGLWYTRGYWHQRSALIRI
jgi:hypothetical protein